MRLQAVRRFLSSLLSRDKWMDILKVALALALIGFVFSRTNFRQIIALKGSISWTWLFISFLLFGLMTALKSMQYWALFGDRVSYPRVLRVVALQNALTNLVSNAAGIASYLTMLRVERNVKLRHSGAVFIITKASDLLSMGFFLLLSASLVWARIGVLHVLVVLLEVGICLTLILFWTVVFLRQRFILQTRRIMHWLRLDRIDILDRGLNALESLAGQEQRTIVRMFLLGILLSMCYMTMTMAYSYSRVQTFHIPISFWPIIFIASLMQLVSIIPIQVFGGLGVNEVTSVYLYDLFDVVQVDIPAILIGLRVLFYLFNLLLLLYVPIGAMVSWLRTSNEDEVDQTE